MSVASVRPISRDRIRITPAPGYEVVVFRQADGSAEAAVLDRQYTETTRLKIAAPPPGQKLGIERGVDGGFELVYYPENRGIFVCCENDIDCQRPCPSHPWSNIK